MNIEGQQDEQHSHSHMREGDSHGYHDHDRNADEHVSASSAFELSVTDKLSKLIAGVDRLNEIVIGNNGLQGAVQEVQKDIAARDSGQLFQKILIGLCTFLLGVTVTLITYASKVAVMETKLDVVTTNQAHVLEKLDFHSITLQRLVTKEEIDHPSNK